MFYFGCTETCHVPPVAWWAFGSDESFYLALPNFCWIHHQPQKSPKLVMFGVDNLCAAAKTFWNLIRVQQTCHGWKHNTFLSIAFRYSKINQVCSISSIVSEVIRTVIFIFLWRNFKHLKHKQKHLSNIQPDNSKQKKQTKASK